MAQDEVSGRTPTADPIAELLATQGVVVLDGGLATELEARGADLADELWSARLLADDPERIWDVHTVYLEAGADVLVTASYQATIDGFLGAGLAASEEEAARLLLSSVGLAREARDRFWMEPANRIGRLRPLVAASVGPYGAALANGSEYRGDYDLAEPELVAFHQRRFELLAASDADLLAIETIPSGVEARALALLLAAHSSKSAWISFSCRNQSELSDGTDFESLVALLEAVPNLAAIGVNCTAPRHVSRLIERARRATSKPIVVYPNSGERWDADVRRWLPSEGPADFAALAVEWRAAGASLIGGCCRTGPGEIAAIRAALVSSASAGGSDFSRDETRRSREEE